MSRWWTYVRERFPLPVYALLVAGLCASAQIVAGALRAGPFALAFVGVLLFFAELRLMDEAKDYDKDRVAHPTRPLPRGLIAIGEARAVIRGGLAAMIAWSALVAVVASLAAGALYAVVTLWLWLMYREFFAGAWLDARPALYAATHQIVLVPLCAFAAATAREEAARAFATYAFAASVLGAFFAWEVARKLDPSAHPVLRTYRSVYGARGAIALIAATALVAAAGDFAQRLHPLLWPAIALLFASLAWLAARPSVFARVEAIASLVLLVHLWGPVLQRILGWPR